MKTIGACVVSFKRDAKVATQYEKGIAVMKDTDVSNVTAIYDMDMKIVDELWDYQLLPEKGCFMFRERGILK